MRLTLFILILLLIGSAVAQELPQKAILGQSTADVRSDAQSAASVHMPETAAQRINNEIAARHLHWKAGETTVSRLPVSQQQMLLGAQYTEGDGSGIYAGTSTAPPTFDWRDVNGSNWVTPIKDQGICNSCVAFSTVGATESHILIALKNPNYPINLAEQDVLSCAGSITCEIGGTHEHTLAYLKSAGVAQETCFPYDATQQLCSNKCAEWQSGKARVLSYARTGATPDAIKQAIANNGPVIVMLAVFDDFYSYQSGVYESAYGEFRGFHSVLLIGYDDAGQYWIAKNEWGTGWGEDGYFKIAYSQNVPSTSAWISDPNDFRTLFLDQAFTISSTDVDSDGIADEKDNCPLVANANQSNIDKDAGGDLCDTDMDGDGFANEADACPFVKGVAAYNGCPDTVAPAITGIALDRTIVRPKDFVLVSVNVSDLDTVTNVSAEGVPLSFADGTWSGQVPLSKSPLDIIVKDASGNTGRNSSVSYILDKKAPKISKITLPAYVKAGTLTGLFSISEDHLATVRGLVGSDPLSPNATAFTYEVQSDAVNGKTSVQISASDLAGNNASKNTTFIIDTVTPVLNAVLYNTTKNNTYLVLANVTELNPKVISIAGKKLTCTKGLSMSCSAIVLSLDPITVHAEDKAGNVAEQTLSLS